MVGNVASHHKGKVLVERNLSLVIFCIILQKSLKLVGR